MCTYDYLYFLFNYASSQTCKFTNLQVHKRASSQTRKFTNLQRTENVYSYVIYLSLDTKLQKKWTNMRI